ncbi:MAG: DUF393 domain-containing protein [Candidatus Melainabacteria bacterium]|nr:DUF393 domain-containing protein [Candidatus Melainabacteria bacterium]
MSEDRPEKEDADRLVGEKNLIFYDGVCGLCNNFNKFVLKNDRTGSFAFASLQSDFATRVLKERGFNSADLNTVYVLPAFDETAEPVLSKSDAVIFVAKNLRRPFPLIATIFGIFPRLIRDRVYDLVAKNRYRFFGRYDTCLMPGSEDAEKFIEV